MRYSSYSANRCPVRDEVKVAVLADELQAEQSAQQQLQETLLVIAAIASALSVMLLLH